MLRSAAEPPTAPRVGGQWAVVVPAKSLSRAKSRMTAELSDPARRLLVRAMLLDVLAASLRCPVVDVVAVVTADRELASLAAGAGARVLAEFDEPSAEPLVVSGGDQTFRYAAAVGLSWARKSPAPYARVAVLASDLPGITIGELDSALDAASSVDRGFVPDADEAGTTLATFNANCEVADDIRTFFGPNSAREFASSGAHDLASGARWNGLRRDVDSIAHLGSISDLGEHTRQVVDSWLADVPNTHAPRSLGKMKG
ncbi:2-phospho-L-lactate guanylyltransferase [Dietzia timorensis]|uniref:2-phospho-L-lactate guanylyltransferase n=1 Tax=Dietzia timorensis TaxID=499555 RepID=A0A173LPQ0_9ACTN|nr:2-phospho-L-lactate guanylyltransferase [Dietzia timorensis]ANI92692.1 2-phospho-L-lactate guanylyltransferase [Dietzia timorensis]